MLPNNLKLKNDEPSSKITGTENNIKLLRIDVGDFNIIYWIVLYAVRHTAGGGELRAEGAEGVGRVTMLPLIRLSVSLADIWENLQQKPRT